MRRLFNSSLPIALAPVSIVEKGINTVTAPIQDDDTSRLCILNMGNIAVLGVKTSSWGGGLSTITSSPLK